MVYCDTVSNSNSMFQFNIQKVSMLLLFLICFSGCREDMEPTGKGMPYRICTTREGIVNSIKTNCNIEFWDYMYKYTYTSIESDFYTLNAPCNETVFSIKYINSVHDHNEPDYKFDLKLNPLSKDEFFKPGSYQVNNLLIWEERHTSGSGAAYSEADITVVWEEVTLSGAIYSGKGKIVIHKDIPHSSFPNYNYPAQEIQFEFPARARTMH